MKVYIVYKAEIAKNWEFIKVFSTEEKAEEYLKDKPYTYGYFEVEVE